MSRTVGAVRYNAKGKDTTRVTITVNDGPAFRDYVHLFITSEGGREQRFTIARPQWNKLIGNDQKR
jgi:hypothetical protein